MTSLVRFALLVLLVVAAGCSRDTITRSQWQQMTPSERELYVKSLVGAEKAKDAKGGGGRSFDQPAEVYVAQIEAAYAAGDERAVHEIFESLESPR